MTILPSLICPTKTLLSQEMNRISMRSGQACPDSIWLHEFVRNKWAKHTNVREVKSGPSKEDKSEHQIPGVL
ncbi:hypothetical protein D5086_003538 [Populus alba]|uniref:Uncharacterized protein n=1 Tax=Populus alba TaxID=43335 RepID=A0ACC4D4L5_POPAL